MRSAHWLGGLVVIAIGVPAAVVACGDTEPSDVPTYGAPGGLPSSGPDVPTPQEDSGAPAPSAGDSGAASSGDGGTAVAPTYACQTAGGTIVDAGACAVSWSKDIYPNMEATGAWTCAAAGCHAPPGQQPQLSGGSSGFYTALANFSSAAELVDSNPYINPCSQDAGLSNFVCNTSTSGTCGTLMPASASITISATGLANIATWVACGAPNN